MQCFSGIHVNIVGGSIEKKGFLGCLFTHPLATSIFSPQIQTFIRGNLSLVKILHLLHKAGGKNVIFFPIQLMGREVTCYTRGYITSKLLVLSAKLLEITLNLCLLTPSSTTCCYVCDIHIRTKIDIQIAIKLE